MITSSVDTQVTRASWVWATSCFALLVVVLPVLFIVTWPQARYDAAVVFGQLLLTSYTGAKLSHIILRGRLRPVDGMFWLFAYVAMGMAPLAQAVTGLTGVPLYSAANNSKIIATIVVLIGLLAYDAGNFVMCQLRQRRARHEPEFGRLVSYRQLRFVSVIAVLLALASIHKLGLGSFFSSRANAIQGQINAGLVGPLQSNALESGSKVASSVYVNIAQTLPLVCFLAWTWTLLRSRRTGSKRPPQSLAYWSILLVVNIVLNNPLSNARYWFLTVVLAFIFGLPGLKSRSFRALIPLGVIIGIVLFPYLDYFRYDTHQTTRQPVEQYIATKDFDQAVMVNNIISTTHQFGYRDGRQLLTDLLFFIPRSDWADKSNDTGTIVASEIGFGSNLNLSAPLWGEFWIDFGPTGVVIGFLLLGAGSRILDDEFQLSRDPKRVSTLAIDLGAPLAAGYSFILLRGSLLQAMGHLSIILIGVYAITRSASGRFREELPRPDEIALY